MKRVTDKLNRAIASKNGRTLLTNFGYLSLLQIVGYIFPLITIPYLARVIGVESFGKIAFASAVVVWFKTIADWGFNYTATRDVAKHRDNEDKISEIFSNVLWARILLAIFSFLLLVIVLMTVPAFKESANILLITFLLVPGHIMFPDWFFQAMERMKYITILNLVSKTLFTLAVFIFIKEKSDYILQPLFISLGYLLSGIIAMYVILYKWKVRLRPPKVRSLIETIKGSTDVFINNIMPNLYNSFSIVLLGFFGGATANGMLDASRKFTAIAQQFMYVISRTFFPFLSRRIEKHSFFSKLYLTTASLFSIVLFFAAPLLIKWFFTPEFYDSIVALRIMSISTLFVALSTVYGTNYLIIEGHAKKLRNITTVCALIGFSISFPLIYYFDFIGAAITLTVTQGIIGVNIVRTALRIKEEKKALALDY